MTGRHDMAAVDVRVRGQVQGVGYRFGALRHASSLDVNGWIRNESNGDVIAHLEGLGYRVDAMLDWLRAGSEWAHVSRVDVVPAALEGDGSFSVE